MVSMGPWWFWGILLMQPYVDVIAKDRQVQEMNNNVSRTFNSIYGNPLLGTLNIVNNITFVSGVAQTVNHKLGKRVTGFIVTNSNAPVNVYQPTGPNPSATTSIILESNANATVSILFF